VDRGFNPGASSTSKLVVIANTGELSIDFGHAIIIGADATAFFIDGLDCAGVTLATGEICGVDVSFSPNQVRQFEARLGIENATLGQPIEVPLKGSSEVIFSDRFEEVMIP
jgi:hypothetical protein